MIGQQVLDYRIEQQIDKEHHFVYLASHITTGKKVSIEFIALRSSLIAEDYEAVKQELQQLLELHHPNINSLLHFTDYNGKLVLISEQVEGLTLDQYIQTSGSVLSEDTLLSIAQRIVSAVSYIHQRNIKHLSINPFNIVITEDDGIKLLDTGLYEIRAKIKGKRVSGNHGLDIHYQSPEQLKRVLVDKSSDIYSIGALLYFLYTGQHPFGHEEGSMHHDVYRQIISKPLPPVSNAGGWISDKMQMVIDKATEKDRSRRFANAEAMLNGIHAPKRRRIINDTVASLTSPEYRAKKVLVSESPPPAISGVIKKRRINRNVLASILLLLMIAVALFTMLGGRGRFAETDARGSVKAFFEALSSHDVSKVSSAFAPVTERFYKYKNYSVDQIIANYQQFWQTAPFENYQLKENALKVIKQNDGTFDIMATVRYDVVVLKPYEIFSYDAFEYQTRQIETEQSKEILYRIRLNEDLKIIYLVEHKSREIPKRAEALSKKWRLARFYEKNIDKSENSIADKIKYQVQKFMEYDYIRFHKDGTYEESLMLGEAKKGTWKLSAGGSQVLIDLPEGRTRIQLIEVGRNYLITSKKRDDKEVISVYKPYQ